MRNPVYEQALNSQKVPWEYLERLELAAIDRTRSLTNQARLEQAVDTDLVAQYRKRYGAGDQFPPLVVYRTNRGRYVLLDGNHRFTACLPITDWKGIKFHDAYLVDSKDEIVLNRIAWGFNNHVNGRRLTYEESLQHAVTFVRKYAWTCQAAATEFSVPHKAVMKLAHIEECKDKLNQQNVKRLPSDNVVDRLSTLVNLGDDVFAAAATTAANTGATAPDIDALLKKVKRAKTHAEKLATIAEFESSDEIQGRKCETKGGTINQRSPTPRVRLQRLQTSLRNFLEDHPIKVVLLPVQKQELKANREVASDIVRLLIGLYGTSILNNTQEAV